ncbi:hypothetical protein K469DRAFT_70387 [Zopfia rhizophila CBS 207.26]|uniref:Uncharacterized protein n=1 Tax=Zopfia rhizophila CBS 207.26 TaxID=1314779 RepID=A0A6A6EDU9_9PEZI|nr:hypothetical protein K469DRAFT_70387 [Zopfia rhizophila CBS 207.26]
MKERLQALSLVVQWVPMWPYFWHLKHCFSRHCLSVARWGANEVSSILVRVRHSRRFGASVAGLIVDRHCFDVVEKRCPMLAIEASFLYAKEEQLTPPYAHVRIKDYLLFYNQRPQDRFIFINVIRITLRSSTVSPTSTRVSPMYIDPTRRGVYPFSLPRWMPFQIHVCASCPLSAGRFMILLLSGSLAERGF